MARKRKASLEGQVTIWLTPEEIFQLESICTIRMADSLAQICRGFILTGMQRETKDILASVALSYKVAERDLETGPSTFRKARDANHLTDEEMDEFLENLKVEKHDQEIFRDTSKGRLRTSMQPILGDRSGTSTGRISSCQGNLAELNPPELDNQGLRGGKADEESLQKPKHVSLPDEYATCPHGTRNADLDPYLPIEGHEVKGHEVDQYANGARETSTTHQHRTPERRRR